MNFYKCVFLVGGVIYTHLLLVFKANAELIPDQTLSINSESKSGCVVCDVNGGTTKGQNLFHSFRQFSIPENGQVIFNNSFGIANIITRVTGPFRSNINGVIKANGSANLFLLNPNGIIFGSNARLETGGSFIATTANSVIFEDGTKFNSVDPSGSSLLTITTPIGLAFGENPGSIVNRSRVEMDIPDFGAITIGLQVQPQKSLILAGGDVFIEGGFLTASPGNLVTDSPGNIEIGSVSGNNQVGLKLSNESWELDYTQIQRFQDIKLSNASTINAGGLGSGKIHIQGRLVELSNASDIFSLNIGDLDGGSIVINSEKLVLRNGSRIAVGTFGTGTSGDLDVTAQAIELTGIGFNGENVDNSGLFSQTFSSGRAGNIVISTNRLTLRDGGQISASAFDIGTGLGLAGTIDLRSSLVEVSGSSMDGNSTSAIFVRSIGEQSGGIAGSLRIRSNTLRVLNNAEISVSSRGPGIGGELEIFSNSVVLDNQAKLRAESLQGQGGNIILNLKDFLFMAGNSEISASAGSPNSFGDGGNISIFADNIVAEPNSNSDVFAIAFGGNGGVINISARKILFGFKKTNDITPRDNTINDITAQSSVGPELNGQININAGEVDPSENLSEQPEIVKSPQEISKGCRPGQTLGGSTFTNVGRGGLPLSPQQTQTPTNVWQDLRSHNLQPTTISSTDSSPSSLIPTPPPSITEAKGWTKDTQGRIYLTANVPQPTQTPQPIATC